jgi:NUDIX domain
MQFRAGAFDVWLYRRDSDEVRYLLMLTSQEKADRWFNGGRFWQVPCDFVENDEGLVQGVRRCVSGHGLKVESIWAVEHTYTIYNRRRESIEQILVTAAEVGERDSPVLSWEHSEYRWCTAKECAELLGYRGLIEGLEWCRRYVTESANPLRELRLA